MARFKYGNHNEVLDFGKFLINNYINKLNEFCPHGSKTNRQCVIDGIDILCRLGDQNDRDTYADIVESALIVLQKELNNDSDYRISELRKDLDIVRSIYDDSNMRSINNGY